MRINGLALLRKTAVGWLSILILLGCSDPKQDPVGALRYYGDGKQLGYEARLGGMLFQRYCVVCHGSTGKGDGFNAFNLTPRPRDLSDGEFQASVADSQLVDIIRHGGSFRGGSRNMPTWGTTFDHQQILNIVSYIRQLKKTDEATLKPAEAE